MVPQWKKKKKNMRILFTLLRNVLLEMQSKILLYTKTTFSCEKVYHFFGLTFQMFYQFFKSWKSQIIWLWFWVTQMIKIYTLRRILFRLTSWFSLPESTCSTNRVRPISQEKYCIKIAKSFYHFKPSWNRSCSPF